MLHRVSFLLCLTLCCAGILPAQAPVVPPGAIVNGASFRPSNAPAGLVAPGSIISIFGSNLASQTVAATNLPLPRSLGSTSVSVNGAAIPLFFVSAGQINAQLPFTVPVGVVQLTVDNSKDITTVSLTVADSGPGLFSQSANGGGPGAILNYVPETQTNVLNTPASTINPNGIIIIYGTGFGAVNNPPADGTAASGQTTKVTPVVSIGGQTVIADFSGLAPGFVGLYQINARVPINTVEGCYLPVKVTFGTVASNTVTIGVNNLRQDCNSSSAATGSPGMILNRAYATAGLSQFTLRPAVPVPGLAVPPDSLGASFRRFPTRIPTNVVFPPINGGCIVSVGKVSGSGGNLPDLSIFVTDKSLDAGILTLTGPSGTAQTINPSTTGEYSATLSGNGLTGGIWKLVGSGGADVGNFSSTLSVPGPFTITSFGIKPDGTFKQSETLNVTWSCPDASGQVATMLMSTDTTKGLTGTALCTFSCGAGKAAFGPDLLGLLPPSGTNSVNLLLLFSPSIASTAKFQAFGIDQGWFGYTMGAGMFMATLLP